MTPQDCQAQGGTFAGFSASGCDPNPCQTVGACCNCAAHGQPGCADFLTAEQCAHLAGCQGGPSVFYPNQTCAQVSCINPQRMGGNATLPNFGFPYPTLNYKPSGCAKCGSGPAKGGLTI